MTNDTDNVLWEHAFGRSDGEQDGVWCVVCGGFLPADEDGVVVHDAIPHPLTMLMYDEDGVLH